MCRGPRRTPRPSPRIFTSKARHEERNGGVHMVGERMNVKAKVSRELHGRLRQVARAQRGGEAHSSRDACTGEGPSARGKMETGRLEVRRGTKTWCGSEHPHAFRLRWRAVTQCLASTTTFGVGRGTRRLTYACGTCPEAVSARARQATDCDGPKFPDCTRETGAGEARCIPEPQRHTLTWRRCNA